MITLKKTDVYGQLLLLIGAFMYIFISKGYNASYCYYAVGAWQLTSFFVHAVFRKNIIVVVCRNFYSFFLILSAASFLICTALRLHEQMKLLLMAFLFLSPLMAIYYLLISFRELSIWEHRQFIQLR